MRDSPSVGVRIQAGRLVRFRHTLTALVIVGVAFAPPANVSALALKEVGTFDSPTYITSDPEDPGRLFVVERNGGIKMIERGRTSVFLDVEEIVHQQGMWSMALSPNYASDGLFYVAYAGVDDLSTAGKDESGYFHIDEFNSNGDIARPGTRREVLTIEYPKAEIVHYGGQLNFGPDRRLYVSTGDGTPTLGEGDPDGNAQNTQNLLAKILRIAPDGLTGPGYRVPTGNPFTNRAGCIDGCDEIWSYGLRNPWRFSFDRLTGALVIADVGANAWEEVNYEPASAGLGWGDNFGWNCREGAHDYPGPGEPAPVCANRVGTFTEPVFEYPRVASGPCSIIGGYVVRDRALADLYGRYMYGDFCTGELRSLNLGLPTANGDRSEALSVPNVTSFGEDAQCRIYVASLNGPVYRLVEPALDTFAGCPEPSPASPPGGEATPPGAGPLALDLDAKKQNLRRKLKFFAIASADSTLVAKGKAIKRTTQQLAANDRTKVKAKLKPTKRKKLSRRLDTKGKARTKVKGAVTDESGLAADDKVKVRLRE